MTDSQISLETVFPWDVAVHDAGGATHAHAIDSVFLRFTQSSRIAIVRAVLEGAHNACAGCVS